MKATLFALAALLAVCLPASATQCHVKPVNLITNWVTMHSNCRAAMRRQIQMEVNASLQYLTLAAHFSKDVVNRPGFAKMFFDAAGEEREHAMKLIEYFLMRGELTSDVSSLLRISPITVSEKMMESGAASLEFALSLEAQVTQSIRKVIMECEDADKNDNFNDYHLVDYLTGDFLDEQYKGQRDLAGKASTLKKMTDLHGALGEFLFDKKLLGMSI